MFLCPYACLPIQRPHYRQNPTECTYTGLFHLDVRLGEDIEDHRSPTFDVSDELAFVRA